MRKLLSTHGWRIAVLLSMLASFAFVLEAGRRW
jgi:hypothetical protein